MGNYLNPGSQAFQMILESEIFVDKSALIAVAKQICAHDAAIYVCESSEKIW